mgnify:CR=1 FL=1|tara:strand:+ start:600 stop:983 length:384 start_codon:yes stop_codon:yes gene_type:complete
MQNYYKILELENFNKTNLEESYKNSLKKYKYLPFYSNKNKDEIKLIKESYYVLTNDKLNIIYDQKLKKSLKKNYNLERDVLRNNYNNTLCNRNFKSYNKSAINIDKELELKKSKLNIYKKNNNYINE